MFKKFVDEVKKLNPNFIFDLVNMPMGEVYLDIRGGASVPLKAILKLPEGWNFKKGCDNYVSDGRVDLHIVPLP